MQEILIIAGLLCAGKTTVANEFKRLYSQQGRDAEIIKFVDPVYKAQSLFGADKNRAFLQGMASLVRETYGAEKFIDMFEVSVATAIASNRPVICDDLRHQSEYDRVHGMGATVIWVETPEHVRKSRGEALGTWGNTNHASEGGLKRSTAFHYVIWDNGSMTDLIQQVEDIYENLGTTGKAELTRPELPLSQYDAIEIAPVLEEEDGMCQTVIEESDLATMWSVYLHLVSGHVECIADFPLHKHGHALKYAAVISRNMGWPVYNYTGKEVTNG